MLLRAWQHAAPSLPAGSSRPSSRSASRAARSASMCTTSRPSTCSSAFSTTFSTPAVSAAAPIRRPPGSRLERTRLAFRRYMMGQLAFGAHYQHVDVHAGDVLVHEIKQLERAETEGAIASSSCLFSIAPSPRAPSRQTTASSLRPSSGSSVAANVHTSIVRLWTTANEAAVTTSSRTMRPTCSTRRGGRCTVSRAGSNVRPRRRMSFPVVLVVSGCWSCLSLSSAVVVCRLGHSCVSSSGRRPPSST